MATTFLEIDEVFTVPPTNTNDAIFGATGSEAVNRDENLDGTHLDGNILTAQVMDNVAE